MRFPNGRIHYALIIFSLCAAQNVAAFGSLFTNQAQRLELDKRRNTGVETVVQAASAKITEVNGLVYRSNGRHIAWVNGTSNFSAAITDHNRHFIGQQRVTLELGGDSHVYRLKPGQQLRMPDALVVENYETRKNIKVSKKTEVGAHDVDLPPSLKLTNE